MNSDPIKQAIDQFSKLPGIGERTALRLVLHLIAQDRNLIALLSNALLELDRKVQECEVCRMITAEGPRCAICSSLSRDRKIICVVARVQDLIALEASSAFRGLYHVLHGVLAPMEGVGPAELRMSSLQKRLQENCVEEIILATPFTVEGEATALYLLQELAAYPIRVTRIASGVPAGGDLQFLDRLTLSRAVASRRGY